MSTEQSNESKQPLSSVEEFFYSAQKKLGGNLMWHDLNPMDQMQFVSACNTLSQICQARK